MCEPRILEISWALQIISGISGFAVEAVRLGVSDAYAIGKGGTGRVSVPETDVPKGGSAAAEVHLREGHLDPDRPKDVLTT